MNRLTLRFKRPGYGWGGSRLQPLHSALGQALRAQAVGCLLGLGVLACLGQLWHSSLWMVASGLGAVYLCLLALSSAAVTGQRSTRAAIAQGLGATILRWAVLGALLAGLGGGELDKTIIALLSCFSYNWAVLLVWFGQWLIRHR